MSRFLGRHCAAGNLHCESIFLNGNNVEDALNSQLTSNDLDGKQNALSIVNQVTSSTQGGIQLVDGVLTYTAAQTIDWSTDQQTINIGVIV